jgi:acyl carrier protein
MDKFIEKLSEALESSDPLSSETILDSLDEWDSLGKLSVISMIMEDYQVNIGVEAIKGASTILDLFNLANGK